MGDVTRIDWQAMRAARQKYRRAVVEAEGLVAESERANLTHTLSKLGMYLDEATQGAFSAADVRVPNTNEGSGDVRGDE